MALQAPLERWRKRGASGHVHMLQDDRFDEGTSGTRQKPRRKVHGGSGLSFAEKNDFIDRIVDAAQPEHLYPQDGGRAHRWQEGEALCLNVEGRSIPVTVELAFEVFGRLRYRLNFIEQGAHFALTEAQIVKLMKPVTVLSPVVIESVSEYLEMVALKRGSRRLDIRQRRTGALQAL